ncbi:MAG: lysoplasmalogenase [Candidatus Hydrogenedentota bacterium]
MKTIPSRALLAAGLTVAFCIVCLLMSASGFSSYFKMAASFSFLATALLAGAHRSMYGRILFAGLVCSSFGDYFLLSGGESRFLAGLVAFLVAHLAYCAAYTVRGLRIHGLVPSAVAIVIVGVLVIRWVWPHVPSDLQIPVAAYTVVIGIMVILAGGTVSQPGGGLILLGAVMFYVSDIFVARQQFVSPGFENAVLGLPLYFTGQAILALSVAPVNAETLEVRKPALLADRQ